MRGILNKKVSQLMIEQKQVFGEFVPSKLFSDLCEFYSKIESEIQQSQEVLIEESYSPQAVDKHRDSLFSGEDIKRATFNRPYNNRTIGDFSLERIEKPKWVIGSKSSKKALSPIRVSSVS